MGLGTAGLLEKAGFLKKLLEKARLRSSATGSSILTNCGGQMHYQIEFLESALE
jgi:hypothetical protein